MADTNYPRLFQSGVDFTNVTTPALTTNQNYAISATYTQSNKTGVLYIFNKAASTGTTASSNSDSRIEIGRLAAITGETYPRPPAMVFSSVLSTADRTTLYNDQRAYYAAQ